jgi:hypothetical protein
MLNVIDKTACDGGFGPYKNIYETFLKRTNCQELLPIFEISRYLRNSMHNNGTRI